MALVQKGLTSSVSPARGRRRAERAPRSVISPTMYRAGGVAAALALAVSGGAYAAVQATGPDARPMTESQARLQDLADNWVVEECPRRESAQQPVRAHFLGSGVAVFEGQGDISGHEQGRAGKKTGAGRREQAVQGRHHRGQHPAVHGVRLHAFPGADGADGQTQRIGRFPVGGRQGVGAAHALRISQTQLDVGVAHVEKERGPRMRHGGHVYLFEAKIQGRPMLPAADRCLDEWQPC